MTRRLRATAAAVARAPDRWSRNAARTEGTKCTTVTCSAEIAAAISAGSRWASGGAIAWRAPMTAGRNSSQSDTSNVNGVL
ncbi:hypothetical protein ACH61_03154 [Rathayibacter tanaceti]|uniref:Uncharacterized protein n=1 Tax=Rathayibacter tanaceti TaxID=1671680 RepID=A0A162FUN1_9MICO|nr:hypothetical protein ACH61_03154 [Rathayibacter tanaceti]